MPPPAWTPPAKNKFAAYTIAERAQFAHLRTGASSSTCATGVVASTLSQSITKASLARGSGISYIPSRNTVEPLLMDPPRSGLPLNNGQN